MNVSSPPRDWTAHAAIDFEGALGRLAGVVPRTPLVPFDLGLPGVELFLKLENRQETGAFKARGAWNQISQLAPAERARGVVACSSGNHGKALAWAAARAGVPATIVMPKNSYPNKIAACRDEGAEVVLAEDRGAADALARERADAGLHLVHPYDALRTIEGAGTVALEVLEDLTGIDAFVVPIGGGGLAAGCSLALRRALGDDVEIVGVEPSGAMGMHAGVRAGRSVPLERVDSRIQGLTPPYAGHHNVAICRQTLDRLVDLDDDAILAAQRELVRAGEVVEPAGAAAFAAVREGLVPATNLPRSGASEKPLRIVVVISGGNPDPAQLQALRASL